ncbi:MAG: ABC transporter permease [Verrucomicrobiia bacterium]
MNARNHAAKSRKRRPDWAVRTAALFLLALFAMAVIGPELFPEDKRDVSEAQFVRPSGDHLLGTDLNGRDLFYRLLIGARVSLIVGVAGALVSLFIGVTYGLVSGYCGGQVDRIMMRMVDVLYSVPRLIFILILVNVFDDPFQKWLFNLLKGGPLEEAARYSKILLMIFALGFIEWLTMARIIRGQVLVLKEAIFVQAARALGQNHFGIFLRHLLPNLRGLILVYLTLIIPTVIIDESFISFLGLGLDATQSSWGVLLKEGAQAINPIDVYWWLLIFPALTLTGTLLALNTIGESLRERHKTGST